MSFLAFQKNNLRAQHLSTVGALLVGQLRQVPGVSVAGAEAVAGRLGGTLAQLSRALHGMSPGAAQVLLTRDLLACLCGLSCIDA